MAGTAVKKSQTPVRNLGILFMVMELTICFLGRV